MRLWLACLTLTVVCLLALGPFAWVGNSKSGPAGVLAALVAAGVCWSGAVLALICTGARRGPKQAVARLMLGMLFRMGLPLVGGAILDWRGGEVAEAGVFGMIVGFYLITLVVETWLSLRVIGSASVTATATEAA